MTAHCQVKSQTTKVSLLMSRIKELDSINRRAMGIGACINWFFAGLQESYKSMSGDTSVSISTASLECKSNFSLPRCWCRAYQTRGRKSLPGTTAIKTPQRGNVYPSQRNHFRIPPRRTGLRILTRTKKLGGATSGASLVIVGIASVHCLAVPSYLSRYVNRHKLLNTGNHTRTSGKPADGCG